MTEANFDFTSAKGEKNAETQIRFPFEAERVQQWPKKRTSKEREGLYNSQSLLAVVWSTVGQKLDVLLER